ncbi:hypothetical protein FUAX_18390 [Fulvitalea axinellae]|uniref:Uncharacterized protein n=1 Tax=Fulvitalea axinellae TaxID=1182444 RepID=A0AAU9CR01_9BACT|nr:hypothetical protein FUAX_18390 [Fulvitalea axinellae]
MTIEIKELLIRTTLEKDSVRKGREQTKEVDEKELSERIFRKCKTYVDKKLRTKNSR